MSFKKKQTEEILKFDTYKLKDRLEFSSSISESDSITKSPFEKLDLGVEEEEISSSVRQPLISLVKIRLMGVALVVVLASFLLSPFLSKQIDPLVFKILSLPFVAVENFCFDQVAKPYVLTVGEYGNFSIAKSEAIKLLPILKQVNIKQLSSGIYTFEIERFSSKKKAYKSLAKLEQGGFEVVHVRYLKD